MELNAIVSVISTLGFPIVCCVALFWMINKNLKALASAVEKNTEATANLVTLIMTIHDEEGV